MGNKVAGGAGGVKWRWRGMWQLQRAATDAARVNSIMVALVCAALFAPQTLTHMLSRACAVRADIVASRAAHGRPRALCSRAARSKRRQVALATPRLLSS